MDIAEKVLLLKQDYDDVHTSGFGKGYETGRKDGEDYAYFVGLENGKKAEHDRFWDMYQDNGKRRNYNVGYGGTGWTDETYNPKYDMICTGSAQTMYGNSKITTTKRLIDWSAVTSTNYAFANCPLMIEIVMLVVSETTPFHSTTFSGLTNLVEMRMGGTIGQNGFDVSKCTKLSHDSLMSIIYALQDKTTDTSGTSWVITLGTENLAKLTDAEKAIATQKGWSLA